MIVAYEAEDKAEELYAPREYAITQQHKHLKEMAHVCGLDYMPGFSPIVGDFYSGMEVSVQLFDIDIEAVRDAYRLAYPGPMIRYMEGADEAGFLSAAAYSGRDDMEITVYGTSERALLTARFDNLGKGASGAAIQNMNILLGVSETEGLVV